MDYTELSNKINHRDYYSRLAYPPFRKEFLDREKYKEADSKERKAWNDDTDRLEALFAQDLRDYLESELGRKLTDKQFNAIYYNAYEKGHSSGYSEILTIASDLIDLVKILLEA